MATPRELGYNFISQSPYLQNDFVPNEITFNESPDINTGIFGPGMNPFPIIPQADGSDGGGGGINPNRTDPNFDYEFDALGGLNNPDNVGLTEEEQELMNQMRFGKALTPMQILGIGLNPIGGGIRAFFRNQKQKRDAEKKLTEVAALANTRDMAEANRAAGTGGYQAGYSDDFMTGGDSQRDDAQEETSPGSSGPGGSDTMGSFAYGGRAGYRSGRLVDGIINLFKSSSPKVGFRSRKDIPLEQYSKMEAPITTKMMEEIPESELKKIFRTQELGLYSETPEILKAGNLMQRFTKEVGGKRVIDYERAEDILNVKLRGNETLDELFKIEFRTRPVERAYGGIVGMYR